MEGFVITVVMVEIGWVIDVIVWVGVGVVCVITVFDFEILVGPKVEVVCIGVKIKAWN